MLFIKDVAMRFAEDAAAFLPQAVASNLLYQLLSANLEFFSSFKAASAIMADFQQFGKLKLNYIN